MITFWGGEINGWQDCLLPLGEGALKGRMRVGHQRTFIVPPQKNAVTLHRAHTVPAPSRNHSQPGSRSTPSRPGAVLRT